MTRAQDTKPTEAECAAAQKWVQDWFNDESLAEEPTSGLIARALAAQRAEIHARYEAVADRIEQRSDDWGDAWHEAGDWIRAVKDQ